ncbi:MAG: T9SS type A sorting domain-containing protein [bacterium]
MRKFLIILIFAFGFSQTYPVKISDKALDPVNQPAEPFDGVNWEYEVVDSAACPKFNSLAIDANNIPHIVYDKIYMKSVAYAHRSDGFWQKEMVDSAYLFFGFSVICNSNNNPHISYYVCKDSSLSKTYICHGYPQDNWIIDTLDSIAGWLGNYFGSIKSSIDLDTSDLPGIAYIAWNVADSLHYIKYAHYNGIDWDTSIVARDTTWHHRYPLDYSPSLKFVHESTPHIAFHRIRGDTDTIKIGYYDDTLNTWIISPAVCYPYGGYPVSLALSSQDYPCIAHGWGAAVAYSWWDSLSWYTESTGTTMGWIDIRIVLDLDSLDNPHIAYLPDPMVAHPCYSYKQNGIWYNCGWIEPDSSTLTVDVDISFALDNNDQPHVCYPAQTSNGYFKYAKGTFTGIEENNVRSQLNVALICFPSLTKTNATLRYTLPQEAKISLSLYDNLGRLTKNIYAGERTAGTYSQKVSLKELPCGVYHLLLKTPGKTITRKIVKLE